MPRPAIKTDRIVEAATQLFATYGFNGVTLRQIADAAEVSQGLVIHHFGTVEALYQHVVETIRPHTAELLLPRLKEHETPTRTVLLRFLTEYIAHRVRHRDRLRILDWARLQGDAARSAEEIEFLDTLAAWFAKGQKSGVLRNDITPKEMILMTSATVQYWIGAGAYFGPAESGKKRTTEQKKGDTDHSAKRQAEIADLLMKTVFLP